MPVDPCRTLRHGGQRQPELQIRSRGCRRPPQHRMRAWSACISRLVEHNILRSTIVRVITGGAYADAATTNGSSCWHSASRNPSAQSHLMFAHLDTVEEGAPTFGVGFKTPGLNVSGVLRCRVVVRFRIITAVWPEPGEAAAAMPRTPAPS